MVNPVVYEQSSKITAALAKVLDDICAKLGNPPDVSTQTGWKVLDQIVKVWESYFPEEVAAWKHDRADDLANERTLQQHIKGGIINQVTYPPTLFALIRTLLPEQKLQDKKFHHELVKRYPLFHSSNYKV